MEQEIFINLDDSGKLSLNEKVSVYSGVVFFSKREKDKFITQYRKIINEIKCSYCKQDNNLCTKKCPEIKNTNIKNSHKRRLMNYIDKYYTIALIINNGKVYNHILNDKSARGRYTDYAIRKLIKEMIKEFIKKSIINPNKKLKLIINIDEQSTKTNGYYNLSDGLYEELRHGIVNYNYNKIIKPIIYNDLELYLSYQNSSKSYVIQAADLLAGTVRKVALENIDNNIKMGKKMSDFINFKIKLP